MSDTHTERENNEEINVQYERLVTNQSSFFFSRLFFFFSHHSLDIWSFFFISLFHFIFFFFLFSSSVLGRVFLPPVDISRRVRVFSTDSSLSFGENLPFILEAGRMSQLDYLYTSTTPQPQSCLFYLIDCDHSLILQSWLLNIHSKYPRVNNVFHLTLSRANHTTGLRKVFEYENVYNTGKMFRLESSNHRLLQLREEIIHIPPNAKKSIHLLVVPPNRHNTKNEVVFVFIKEHKTNKTEECLQFNITYKD